MSNTDLQPQIRWYKPLQYRHLLKNSSGIRYCSYMERNGIYRGYICGKVAKILYNYGEVIALRCCECSNKLHEFEANILVDCMLGIVLPMYIIRL